MKIVSKFWFSAGNEKTKPYVTVCKQKYYLTRDEMDFVIPNSFINKIAQLNNPQNFAQVIELDGALFAKQDVADLANCIMQIHFSVM